MMKGALHNDIKKVEGFVFEIEFQAAFESF